MADAPPLLRDPRLDDPAELALEAAAIALAAVLLQNTQEAMPQPLVAEEQQTDVGSERGAFQAPADAQATGAAAALPVPVPVPSTLPAAGLTQPIPLKARSIPVPPEEQPAAVRLVVSKVQPPEQRQPTNASLGENTPASASVVPSIVPSIVLTAKPDQAVALASGETGLSFSQQLEIAPLLPVVAAPVAPAPAPLQENPQSSAQASVSVSLPPLIQAPAEESSQSKASVDAELLASALPGNPAAAFFAVQTTSPQPMSEQEPVLVDSEASERGGGSGREDLDELEADPDVKSEDLSLVRKEMQGTAAEGRLKQMKAPVSGAKAAQTSGLGSSAEARPEVGTFGAQERGVLREISYVSEPAGESPTSATAEAEVFSSLVSPPAELPGATPSQTGVGTRPAHETYSRPTVLPPVHTKSSELFNVVQNALERARSENPSHLAVEITLEDGSSFGLEVRMNASGLQASFRSESQPLLKALENSWAGFLAKESADSKVVSAAFEGRSGSGEFSNNGSTAGERREQFEDSASAAFLANQDGGGAAPQKPQSEAARKDLGATGGMALYA